MNLSQSACAVLLILLLTYISVSAKRADQIEHLRNELTVLKEECIGVPGVKL